MQDFADIAKYQRFVPVVKSQTFDSLSDVYPSALTVQVEWNSVPLELDLEVTVPSFWVRIAPMINHILNGGLLVIFLTTGGILLRASRSIATCSSPAGAWRLTTPKANSSALSTTPPPSCAITTVRFHHVAFMCPTWDVALMCHYYGPFHAMSLSCPSRMSRESEETENNKTLTDEWCCDVIQVLSRVSPDPRL